MLYTTVLFLEFSPIVLERFRLSTPLRIMRKVTPILVILGVILSTLHQSSLGSLFLIIPGKLHAFWYSPILPVLFFVSALSVGMAMVVVESWFSRRAFGKPLETHLLQRVSRASVIVLALYLALRLRDLALRDTIAQFLAFDRYSYFLLAELGLGVLVPMVLLASDRFRQSPKRLAMAQGLVVLGFVFHRLNVSVTAFEAATGQTYIPAIPEFLASMGLVALGMLLFMAACQWLPVFPEGPVAEVERSGGFEALASHAHAPAADAAAPSR
jgi:Ni/Fe-hydrogenase subunit HybB-like protein